MSDEGNVNGEVIDSPTVNSYVVGVSIVEGETAPTAATAPAPKSAGYDPGAYTVEEVQSYVAKHPDQRCRRARRRTGRQEPGHAHRLTPGGNIMTPEDPDPTPDTPPEPDPNAPA